MRRATVRLALAAALLWRGWSCHGAGALGPCIYPPAAMPAGDAVFTSPREIRALLVDGDRLIASVQGYMYCLEPLFGQQVWSNPLEGMGVGTPCLASAHGSTGSGSIMMSAAADIAAQQQQHAAGAAAMA